jgi:hypothetical protein
VTNQRQAREDILTSCSLDISHEFFKGTGLIICKLKFVEKSKRIKALVFGRLHSDPAGTGVVLSTTERELHREEKGGGQCCNFDLDESHAEEL